jgi:hypothetical protein
MVLFQKTADILREVRDLGRRLTGINTELPAAAAYTELRHCQEELNSLVLMVELQVEQEAGHDGTDTD